MVDLNRVTNGNPNQLFTFRESRYGPFTVYDLFNNNYHNSLSRCGKNLLNLSSK